MAFRAIDKIELPLVAREERHSIHKMVLYYISLGKGVIVPYTVLVQKFLSELKEIDPQYDPSTPWEDEELLRRVVERQIGDQYEMVTLGHDAFHPGGYRQLDALTDRDSEAYGMIQNWLKDGEEQLIFIGKYKKMTGAQMNTRPDAPELLYSLAAFLPEIVEYYPKLLKEDVSSLEPVFGQEPEIWTFGTDCACCS